jgi:lysyl-tRNA synthetase class 1
MQRLHDELTEISLESTAEDLQTIVFEIGKQFAFTDLRQWFGTLYEVLLGQEEGPRMGSFIALFGIAETRALIQEKLS